MALLLSLAPRAGAASDADAVFREYGDHVVQVRLVDRASRSKSSIGTGFFVHGDGYLVTNYHVVSALVHHPDRYLVEMAVDNGVAEPLRLARIDVVHDLAILQAGGKREGYFEWSSAPLDKGARIFALGNPYDLGSSIIEGTYNGLIENSLYEKIHFSGSLSPGMSGGPAITLDGRVVGINVSTAGNQVSFLVPAAFAVDLLEHTLAAESPADQNFLDVVRDQLLEHQAMVMDALMDADFETVRLGEYDLPGKPAPYFNCWGNTVQRDDQPYEIVNHTCRVEDTVYVSRGLDSGTIRFGHSFLHSNELSPLRFFALYESQFAISGGLYGADREQVGPFRCTTDFLDRGGSTLKTVFCARGYRKLEGLYDVILKAASIDHSDRGVQTFLSATGVSYEHAERFARRYLESITWTKD